MESFVDWLESELQARHMSPTELSRVSGISQPAMSRILNQQRKASPETLQAIAKALNLPVEVVYERAGILKPTAPSEDDGPMTKAMRELLTQLPEEEVENLYNMALGMLERWKRKKK